MWQAGAGTSSQMSGANAASRQGQGRGFMGVILSPSKGRVPGEHICLPESQGGHRAGPASQAAWKIFPSFRFSPKRTFLSQLTCAKRFPLGAAQSSATHHGHLQMALLQTATSNQLNLCRLLPHCKRTSLLITRWKSPRAHTYSHPHSHTYTHMYTHIYTYSQMGGGTSHGVRTSTSSKHNSAASLTLWIKT